MSSNLVHFELPVPDTKKGQEFYGRLLGWEFQDWDGYLMIGGSQPTGAIMAGNGANPVVYFHTDDIDASVAQVRELGGKGDDPQDIPGVGRYTSCRDDQGTAFGLFQAA